MSKFSFNFEKVSKEIRDSVISHQSSLGLMDAYKECEGYFAYMQGLEDGILEANNKMHYALMKKFTTILANKPDIKLSEAINLLKK